MAVGGGKQEAAGGRKQKEKPYKRKAGSRCEIPPFLLFATAYLDAVGTGSAFRV